MLDEAKLARLVQDFYAAILDQENRARLALQLRFFEMGCAGAGLMSPSPA